MKKTYLIPSLRVADIAGEENLLQDSGIRVRSNVQTDELGEAKAEHNFGGGSKGSAWSNEW